MPEAAEPIKAGEAVFLDKDGKWRSTAFHAWLDDLEKIMREWDAKHGNLPYVLPFERSHDNGNVACWRDSYDDGMTPQEAFDSDQSYWEE